MEIRLNGGNRSFYHYGRGRTDLRVDASNENCYYCHQNSSTTFAIAMRNASANSSIFNHTDNTVVECTNAFCQSTGLIHDNTLNKPSFANAQCIGCHSLLSPSISNTHNREHDQLLEVPQRRLQRADMESIRRRTPAA